MLVRCCFSELVCLELVDGFENLGNIFQFRAFGEVRNLDSLQVFGICRYLVLHEQAIDVVCRRLCVCLYLPGLRIVLDEGNDISPNNALGMDFVRFKVFPSYAYLGHKEGEAVEIRLEIVSAGLDLAPKLPRKLYGVCLNIHKNLLLCEKKSFSKIEYIIFVLICQHF